MNFAYSERVEELRSRLLNFFDEHIHPNEALHHHQHAEAPDRWQPVPIVEELKPKARAAGLWNLFLPHSDRGAGLSNLEYAPLAEIMGGVPWSSEVFNCSAPDTGNMETIDRFGTDAQKREWLDPLLDGKIRSCFGMTEPTSPPPTPPTSRRGSSGMATTTSSTAASGGPRAPATRAAPSSSSWARRRRTARTSTGGNR